MSWLGEFIETPRPRCVLTRATKPERRRIFRTFTRKLVGVVIVLVVAVCAAVGEDSEGAGTLPASQLASPNFGVLVVGEGASETYARCIVCHSERLVAQQGLTRQDWEEVIDLMVEEHGMVPIESSALDRVLGYLSTHYGPDRPNFPLR